MTGHGYGHAVRSARIMGELRASRPDVEIRVRTGAPAWLFPADRGVRVEPAESDVGLIQRSGIDLDLGATLERLDAFDAGWSARVDAEAAWLEEARARLVVADVPPLAFAAAARAGLPAVAVANFSWDWIYESYVPGAPAFARHAERARRAYGEAVECLRLPFHGDLGAFRRIRDVPVVARVSRLSRQAARRALGLPLERPLVLLSFGGFGLETLDAAALGAVEAVEFVATERYVRPPRNLRSVDRDRVDYVDLLRACDAVVTKPGYGITAESLANGVRVLHTSRGAFPEAPVLVEALERHGTSAFVEPERVRAGDLAEPLAALLARPVRATGLSFDGARVAAAAIAEHLGTGPV